MTHTLKANGLKKRYDKRAVVRGISVEVRQGEIVGLLGPIGAGKTITNNTPYDHRRSRCG